MKHSQIKAFERLHAMAHEAGMAAGNAAKPVAMVVGEAVGLSDRIDYSKPTYYVADGVCGFAWVHMSGKEAFARWAKERRLGHKGYPNGWDIWVGEFGQSMQRKEAYAGAYAAVLKAHGIEAYAQSRMD